ncbi:MAG: B12-binding domain-containing radical SAM protein [Candidatus Aminicenantes bacterium]
MVDPPGKNKGLNSGLGYLSAVLKDHHQVRILDLNNIKMGFCGDPNPDMPRSEWEERIINAVDEFDPQLFGISVKTYTAEISRHIFKFIRSERPPLITLAGGPHITLDGFRYIQENKIDFGIQGEGEYSILKLAEDLEKDKKTRNIQGLLCWQNGELAHNPEYHAIQDLDSLPFPDYHHFSSVREHGGCLPEYPLLTSRGCPYRCSYCSMPKIMGSKWRIHTPRRVLEELHHAKLEYQSTGFTVVDDNFTLNSKRAEEICDLLILDKMNIPWNCQNGIRADQISGSLAIKMRRSGCRYVWIGIESADEKLLESINKGEELKDIVKGIRHLKRAGIRVGGFFITGLPLSTREADLKSIDFVKEQGIDGWWFYFVPYPHTKAWEWVQAHGRLLRSLDGALQFGTHNIEPVFDTQEYPRESRINTYNEIHIRMKHFDRLVDPCLNQWDKWLKVLKLVTPYGTGKILSLLIFIIKHNAKLAIRALLSNLDSQR